MNYVGNDSVTAVAKAMRPEFRKIAYSSAAQRRISPDDLHQIVLDRMAMSKSDRDAFDKRLTPAVRKALENPRGIMLDPNKPPQSSNSQYNNRTADNGGIDASDRLVDASENAPGGNSVSDWQKWFPTRRAMSSLQD